MAKFFLNPHLYFLAALSVFYVAIVSYFGIDDPSAILVDVMLGAGLILLAIVSIGRILEDTKVRPSLHYLVSEGFIHIIREKVEMEGGVLYGVKIDRQNCPWPVGIRQTSERTLEIFYEDMAERPTYKINLTPQN